MSRIPLRRGDRFLLCSDGLSNMLPDADIHAILKTTALETACSALIEAANARGGKDNITAVLVDVGGEGAPVAASGERISFDAIQPASA